MSAPAANPFERIARAEKVNKLVRTIDRACVSLGLDPVREPLTAAHRLRAALPGFWTDLAKLAECNPPSPFTRREVVGEYVARARENGRRAEPDLDVDLCGCGAPGHDDADGEGVRCDDCRGLKLKCQEPGCDGRTHETLCFRHVRAENE
jgi:hypothetical protein